ncbi:eukaryotic translation initiation factor 4E-binding protein 2-like [Apostichopus japonicus]|uniref:eukaryotic translation initiation factor 4E-binding protein 2-like n=1 Tax=Stichopus japonicus TaxID=307972 RepID=UPI003AB2C91C
MSAKVTEANASGSREIPTRRVQIKDASQMPHEYSTTPGGTMFSTTPGGTRIIYDRDFLMQFRQSPLAQTPPKNLPNIPGVTNVGEPTTNGSAQPPKPNSNAKDGAIIEAEEPQFEMDI